MGDLILCRMPEHILQDAVCSWPDGRAPWTVMDSLPGMPDDVFLQNLKLGFDWWEPYCGIVSDYVTSAAQARVHVYCRRIDGGGGVLAQCELPCGRVDHVDMTIDVGERWLTELNPTQRGILLRLVVAHEAGHAFGMGHAPAGSPNLMAPAYNPATVGAGPWDVEQAVARYGRPVPKPPTPTPIPTPGATKRLVIEFDGEIRNARITESTPAAVPAPVPSGGSFVGSETLKTLQKFLGLLATITALTPNAIDDQVVALIRQIVDAVLAGRQPTPEQLASVRQILELQA